MTYIAPEDRALFERFWRKQLQSRFGVTPPTPEEEIAFIDEFLSAGVLTVPLPNGSEATVTGDVGSALPSPLPAAPTAKNRRAGRSGGSGKQPPWRILGGVLMICLAIIIVVGPMIGKARPARSTAPADSEGLDLVVLPSGVDTLISSGDVRIATRDVVPTTIEILPADDAPGMTFIVVPVRVELADWPCPASEFRGQPGACWVVGTVINYLIGIPYDATIAALAARLQMSGGVIQSRLSTGRTIQYRVAPEQVLTVARHQTEVLAQRRFAITLPLLGQEGGERTVIVGYYDPAQDLGDMTPIVSGGGFLPPANQVIGLGESVTVGVLELLPTGIFRESDTTRLTLLVWNRGDVPLAIGTGWRMVALRVDGSAVEAQIFGSSIAPAGRAEVTTTVPGNASAWRLYLAGTEITITNP